MNENEAPPVGDAKYDPRGLAGLVLSVGIAGAVVMLAAGLLLAVWQRAPITDAGINLLSATLGAAVGALATYLGGYVRQPPGGTP